jgi:hypothetical protein
MITSRSISPCLQNYAKSILCIKSVKTTTIAIHLTMLKLRIIATLRKKISKKVWLSRSISHVLKSCVKASLVAKQKLFKKYDYRTPSRQNWEILQKHHHPPDKIYSKSTTIALHLSKLKTHHLSPKNFHSKNLSLAFHLAILWKLKIFFWKNIFIFRTFLYFFTEMIW